MITRWNSSSRTRFPGSVAIAEIDYWPGIRRARSDRSDTSQIPAKYVSRQISRLPTGGLAEQWKIFCSPNRESWPRFCSYSEKVFRYLRICLLRVCRACENVVVIRSNDYVGQIWKKFLFYFYSKNKYTVKLYILSYMLWKKIQRIK